MLLFPILPLPLRLCLLSSFSCDFNFVSSSIAPFLQSTNVPFFFPCLKKNKPSLITYPSSNLHPLSSLLYQKYLKEYIYWMNENFFYLVQTSLLSSRPTYVKFLNYMWLIPDSVSRNKTATSPNWRELMNFTSPYLLFSVFLEYRLLASPLATHSSTLAWKIPWMEEPGRLQSMGSRRVGHDWETSLSLFTFIHWRRKMATHSSVLAWRIPGMAEPGGLPSMGLQRVGHDWSDLAAPAAASPFT